MRLSKKRIIIAGLFSAREPDAPSALSALAQRIETHGGVVVGQILQRRGVSRDNRPGGSKRMDQPLSGATLLGKGKAEELAELCKATAADLVVFHNELSDRQRRNLEKMCNAQVHDARTLKLDE